MPDNSDVLVLNTADPLAVAAVQAIHTGDLVTLQRLLAEQPRLATARLGDDDGREGVWHTRPQCRHGRRIRPRHPGLSYGCTMRL